MSLTAKDPKEPSHMAKTKTLTHLRRDGEDLAACGKETHEDLDLNADPKKFVVCLTCVREMLDEREEILDRHHQMAERFNEMANRLNAIKTLADPQEEVEFFESKRASA